MNRTAITAAALLLTTTCFAASAQIAPANPNPKMVQAGDYTVEPAHTRVQFSVSHMGFTDWYGDLTSASGSLSVDPAHASLAKVDITLPMASVSTTNAKLDEELKSAAWLDAATYPTIHFVSTKVAVTGANTAAITGNLTFHGVTRPVTLDAVFNGAGINMLSKNYTVGFNATTTIKRSDFGVKTYVPLIGDATSLRISVAFEKNAS